MEVSEIWCELLLGEENILEENINIKGKPGKVN